MREIKFRAWDKEHKKMHYKNIGVMDNDVLAFEEGEWGELCINSSLTPMQFTGLYDKNGKEIYEGDIMKTDYRENEVVEFDDYIDTDGIYNCASGWAFDYGEVIGNIYENPELLNE